MPYEHYLDVCYRQSKSVGQAALNFTENFLDNTSPFIADSKIANHKKLIDPLKRICIDNVSFVDDGGRIKVYDLNLNQNFEQELKRFLARDDKWTHWHPMLIVFDSPDTTMPQEWIEAIRGNNIRYISLNQVDKIRGTEFQEIFVLLSAKTWKQLQEGVPGAGSYTWNKLISLHTVFTRSKDVTIIFVDENSDA